MFEGENLMRGAWSHFMTREGPDGLSRVEQEEQRLQRLYDIADRKTEALMQRDMYSIPIPLKKQLRQGKQQRSSIRGR